MSFDLMLSWLNHFIEVSFANICRRSQGNSEVFYRTNLYEIVSKRTFVLYENGNGFHEIHSPQSCVIVPSLTNALRVSLKVYKS